MADLDTLIQQGNVLRGTRLGSPRFEMWANDARAAVKPYGEAMMEILESAITIHVVSYEDTTNDEQIDDTIEFLEGLKERNPEDSRAQDALINQKQAEARATLQTKFGGSITVHGDETFGDGS